MLKRWLVVLCTVSLLLATPALAGVVVKMAHQNLGGTEPETETMTMTISGKDILMSVPPQGSMIFRGADETMLMVDHEKRNYMEMDRPTLEQLAGQMNQMMKMMEQQLAAMPPEQREMAEKMMKGRMPQTGDGPRPAAELRKTSEKADVAGYPCVKYEVYRGEELTQELWVTPFDRLEGAKEASQAFLGIADFFEILMDALKKSPMSDALPFQDNPFAEMEKLDGFPIRSRQFADGKPIGESTLESLTRSEVAPATFQPPKGYARQELPIGR